MAIAHVEMRTAREEGRLARPDVTGQAWFESLRPHLKLESLPKERAGEVGVHDPNGVRELSEEISRIEKEWGLV
jgi:hypothetical protein